MKNLRIRPGQVIEYEPELGTVDSLREMKPRGKDDDLTSAVLEAEAFGPFWGVAKWLGLNK